MKTPEPDLRVSRWVSAMRDVGLEVTQTFYGFSGISGSATENVVFECGLEHDGSISLGARIGNAPTVRWFIRDTMDEMVELLIAAHNRVVEGQSDSWADAMTELDDRSVKLFDPSIE